MVSVLFQNTNQRTLYFNQLFYGNGQMLDKAVCMNMIAVMDGTANPSAGLLRTMKILGGAEQLHIAVCKELHNNKWSAGGHETNHELFTTPHLRRWLLLVDGQRAPLFACETMNIADVSVVIDETETGGYDAD